MRHPAHYVCVWVTAIVLAIFTAVRLWLRFSANIRNAFGIKKDLLETEKVEHELQEKRQRMRVIYDVAPRKGTFLRTRRLDFQFWYAVLFLILKWFPGPVYRRPRPERKGQK